MSATLIPKSLLGSSIAPNLTRSALLYTPVFISPVVFVLPGEVNCQPEGTLAAGGALPATPAVVLITTCKLANEAILLKL